MPSSGRVERRTPAKSRARTPATSSSSASASWLGSSWSSQWWGSCFCRMPLPESAMPALLGVETHPQNPPYPRLSTNIAAQMETQLPGPKTQPERNSTSSQRLKNLGNRQPFQLPNLFSSVSICPFGSGMEFLRFLTLPAPASICFPSGAAAFGKVTLFADGCKSSCQFNSEFLKVQTTPK